MKSKPDSFKELKGTRHERIAVVGIGNELNGDDAAGILAARKLSKKYCPQKVDENSPHPVFIVIEAGLAPEAFTGPLRRFRPD
jgi:hydrogenase 3 maturation protease